MSCSGTLTVNKKPRSILINIPAAVIVVPPYFTLIRNKSFLNKSLWNSKYYCTRKYCQNLIYIPEIGLPIYLYIIVEEMSYRKGK